MQILKILLEWDMFVQKSNIEIKPLNGWVILKSTMYVHVEIHVSQVGYTNKIQDKHDSVWYTLVLPNRNWSSGKPMWSKMILAVFSGLQGSTIFLMHKILYLFFFCVFVGDVLRVHWK